MKISLESARALSSQLGEASALCNESFVVVKRNESLGLINSYARLVGDFLGHSYMNILAPLWKAHPELFPEEMKGEYEESAPRLSPESEAAIRAFIESAKLALANAEKLLAEEPSTLPFGGIVEVKTNVAEAEKFLERPWNRRRDA